MDRRNFMGTLVGGIALGAAVRSWPFRVYSFASRPQLIHIFDVYAMLSEPDTTYGIKGLYHVHLHNMMRLSDGDIEIAGKRYRKTLSVPPRTPLGRAYLHGVDQHDLDLFRNGEGLFIGRDVLNTRNEIVHDIEHPERVSIFT